MDKVKAHVRKAYDKALTVGGPVAEAAQLRLGEVVAALAAAEEGKRATAQANEHAWHTVQAEGANSDLAIGAARDALWNALGRPGFSPALELVFPDGIGMYRPGNRLKQPELMEVLASRILTAASPRWGKQLRESLAADITAHREGLQRALDVHRPAEVAARVARSVHKATVRHAHDRLRAFKRDLLTMNLTSVVIDEIIPDASKPEHGEHEEDTTKKAA